MPFLRDALGKRLWHEVVNCYTLYRFITLFWLARKSCAIDKWRFLLLSGGGGCGTGRATAAPSGVRSPRLSLLGRRLLGGGLLRRRGLLGLGRGGLLGGRLLGGGLLRRIEIG